MGSTLRSRDLLSGPLQCFTATALFSCSAEQHSAVSRTWHSWRGFEELAVEMLNHHITFLSGLHPESPRGKEGGERKIFWRLVTILRNTYKMTSQNLFCRSAGDFNTNHKLRTMKPITKGTFCALL